MLWLHADLNRDVNPRVKPEGVGEGGGGGGLTRISSDGDNQRIFWVEIVNSRICLGRKIWQVFFLVYLHSLILINYYYY